MLYDLLTEVVHVLDGAAAVVWEHCDGLTDTGELVRSLAGATGADEAQVAADVHTCLRQLETKRVVGRTAPVPRPPEMERTVVTGSSTSAVHAVLDDGVRFVGDDRGLLTAIDEVLGLDDEPRATIDIGVVELGDGSVRLRGWGPDRGFASCAQLLDALPSELNRIAAASSACIALHAGAVRSPEGQVVFLPAVSGAGKTTLTAALVQAGWDYASDEAVGVRAGSLQAVAYPKPLVLDGPARAVLGLDPSSSPNASPAELRSDVRVLRGEIGQVTRVVLPRYDASSRVEVERLEQPQAIVAVLEHALNLARVGQPGLDALCQLADEVPVVRLTHGGVAGAVAAIEELVG